MRNLLRIGNVCCGNFCALRMGCQAITPSAACSGCWARRPSGGCLGPFWKGPGADGPGVLATSGKTLRQSFNRAAGRAPLHVVTGRRCTDGPGLPGLAMIACVQSGRQFGESTARRFHVSPARLTAEVVAKAAGTR